MAKFHYMYITDPTPSTSLLTLLNDISDTKSDVFIIGSTGKVFNKYGVEQFVEAHDDRYLRLVGGTLTGPLTLDSNGSGTTASSHPLTFTGRAFNTPFSKSLLMDNTGALKWGGTALSLVGHTHTYAEITGPVPIWNQDTTGNAATATKLAAAVNINGVAFDGSASITVYDGSKLSLNGGTLQGDLVLAKDGSTEVGSHGIVFQANTVGGDFTRELNIDKLGVLKFNNTTVSLLGHTHTYADLTGTVPTWNQDTTGNAATATTAATATKLAAAVTINGVSFDGSASITVYDGSKLPLSGGTLTGNITFSAPTGASADSRSITFTSRFNSADVTRTLYINPAGTLVFNSVAVSLSGHTHPYSDLTGTVPTWNQNTTGNAATATKLAAAVTINGVSFDGSANITITATDPNKMPLAGGTFTGNITMDKTTPIGGEANSLSVVFRHQTNSVDATKALYVNNGGQLVFNSVAVVLNNDSRLSDARTPLSHTHGNITNAGAIGSTADLVVVTGSSGVLTTQSRSGIDSRTEFPPAAHSHAATALNVSGISLIGKSTSGGGSTQELSVSTVQSMLGLGSAAYVATSTFWNALGSWKPTSLASATRLIGITEPAGNANFGLAYESGRMHAYVDGFFYQNEGAYKVLDENSGYTRAQVDAGFTVRRTGIIKSSSFSADTQALFPYALTTASTAIGFEYNILLNAHRKGYTITQSGTGQLSSTNGLFDGELSPNYSPDGIDPNDPFVLLIAGLPNVHTQTGGVIGWTARYWFPKRYKVETYDSYISAWRTLVDQSATAVDTKDLVIPIYPSFSGSHTQIRITVYEAGGSLGTNGFPRWGLSEIFFIHPEAQATHRFLDVEWANKLRTARTIGGVSFDGSASINLPGVNITGNQDTTGNAATATKLAAAVTINGVSFDGSAAITVYDGTKMPLSGGTFTGDITMDKISTATASDSRSIIFTARAAGIDFTRILKVTTAGALTFNGTAISLVGHTHSYLPLAGGDVNGKIVSYTSDTTGTYHTRSIELREVGLVTNTQSASNYAPALAFHWGGRVQTQIALLANGSLVVRSDTGDGNAIVLANDSRLSDARNPLAHTHGNISNDGKIGSVPGLVVVTGTNGVLTVQSRDGIDSRTSFPAAQHTVASHSATAWRMFYSNATTTAVQELAFGAAGTYLRSGGASAAPTWSTVQYSELGGTVPTWNQSTTGNAATATKLATPVTINGVSFDGSANITVYDGSKLPLAGGTLTGNITFSAPAGAAADSRSITFTSRFNSADVVRTLYINSAGTLVFNSVAVSLSGHTHTYSDLTGTVPTWNQSTTGNAATATKLASPVTINGVSFDGSANITITATDASKLPLTGGTLTGDLTMDKVSASVSSDSRTIVFRARAASTDFTRTLRVSSAGRLVFYDGTADRIVYHEGYKPTQIISGGSYVNVGSGVVELVSDGDDILMYGTGLYFNDTAVSIAGHTHAISNVTGLQTALDEKQPKIVSKRLSSNQTTTGTTLVDASGMSSVLTSGKTYKIEIIGSYATNTTTAGLKLYANFSGSANAVGQSMTTLTNASSVATAEHLAIISTNSNWVFSSGVVTANNSNTFVVSAIVVVSSSGTFKLQFAAETGSATTITLGANTTMIITEIQ